MGVDRREYIRLYQREWIAKRRAEFFADKCCVWCGSTDDLRLDHVDPRLKVDHKIWSWSKARRDAEVAKCQVLCDPCHKIKTRSDLPVTQGCIADRHGSASMYRRGCKCGLCKLWRRNRYREKEQGVPRTRVVGTQVSKTLTL